MKVTVYKERLLKGDSKYWGSQHENLATTLFFDFPEYVEKNGEEIPTAGLNKYIVFDISRPDNQDIIKDGKYSFPHEITKLGTITFWVKLEEPSESEDMSDKLIWISKGLTVSFNKNAEGQIEITNEKLDTFNSLVTTLNLETEKVEKLVTEIETKLENGEFNGQDYVLTDEDRKEIKEVVEKDIQPTLNNISEKANTAVQTAESAESIAKGRAQSVVKDTWEQMEEWLKDVANKGTHNIGDNLYIKAQYTDETKTEKQPDYWISGVLEEPNEKGHYYEIAELGAEKPDLTNLVDKETDIEEKPILVTYEDGEKETWRLVVYK